MTRSRVTTSRRRAVEIITMLMTSPSTPTAIRIQPMVAHSTVVLPIVESSTTPNARIAPSAIRTMDVPMPMTSCLSYSVKYALEATPPEKAEHQQDKYDDDDHPHEARYQKRHANSLPRFLLTPRYTPGALPTNTTTS